MPYNFNVHLQTWVQTPEYGENDPQANIEAAYDDEVFQQELYYRKREALRDEEAIKDRQDFKELKDRREKARKMYIPVVESLEDPSDRFMGHSRNLGPEKPKIPRNMNAPLNNRLLVGPKGREEAEERLRAADRMQKTINSYGEKFRS